MNPFHSVAEDIRWLHDRWWTASFEGVPPAELRRGSTTLRLLLVDGLLQRAWNSYGFPGQPCVKGPDLQALGNRDNRQLRYAIAVVAGGGRLRGVDLALVGAFRVDNPETGILAGAEVGFAVAVTSIARSGVKDGPLDGLVERTWKLNAFLEAPGAAVHGADPSDASVTFSRREIIQYFANYAGGAHLGRVDKVPRKKNLLYEHISKLHGKVAVDTMEGLHFELFSIGQAVARSSDVRALAEAVDSGPPASMT